ncbi:hypothetical protein [Flavobacterium sp. BFFFF1]|uniref:hypothetical protein n=1 Tax=Flavobacterium sp. BFFFF1 TaxID=2015557 RepID=UPI0025C3B236|nr:hypothetical protein [Flavobacterium sp. BFFFF1]
MKNIACLFMFVFVGFGFRLSGQTVLSATAVELKKGKDQYVSFNAVNERNNEVFALLSDKESVHFLRYNSALFLRDTLTVARPEKSYTFILGYAFEDDNPIVFWSDDPIKKILEVSFDVKNKKSTSRQHELFSGDEHFVCSFTERNIFYAITASKNAQNLTVHYYGSGRFISKTIDLSAFEFLNANNAKVPFNDLITQNPIEKIEPKNVNGLVSGIQKIKLYVENNQVFITNDLNHVATQMLRIDLGSFAVTEQNFPHQTSEDSSRLHNSFLKNQRLYQLAVSDQKLSLASRSIDNTSDIKIFSSAEKDTISFRNSPFFSATGTQRPTVIKSLKKFFRKLSSSRTGITVYEYNSGHLLITVGGLRETNTTGSVIAGIALSVGTIATGTDADVTDLFDSDTAETVYFETVVDDQFNHMIAADELLADDFISQFLNESEDVIVSNVFYYRGFYVLSYYDKRAKQYVLRKFEDATMN